MGKFVGCHEDQDYYYLFEELIDGTNLFRFLRKFKYTMEIKEAKFYIAEVVCMLEYLHKNNIVYRDLKPENLMICSDGHLKLIDFGAAKHMKKDRTYTLMGSLHYIAPEVLD